MGSTDPYGLVGATLSGRYSVESFVGVGRFTAVYRGTQLDTLVPVALRLLRVRQDLTGIARPKILAKLDSIMRVAGDVASLCPTFCETREVASIITADGRWMPFIAEAWVDGVTLESVLADERARGKAPRSISEAMDLLSSIGDALAYAHSRSVVHGSFAPRTIFVRDDAPEWGAVEVIDLGLADAIDALQRDHHAFVADDTPALGFPPSHGAPEQIARRFGPIGPWTDVFALALVLVELVTGKAALGDGDDAQLADAALDPVRRPTPRALGKSVGHYVESVFERALAVRPQERYASVAAFWDALRSASRVEYPRTSPSYVPPPVAPVARLAPIAPAAPIAPMAEAAPVSTAEPKRRSLPPPLPRTIDAIGVPDSRPPRSTITPPPMTPPYGTTSPIQFAQPAVARSTPPPAEVERPPVSSRPSSRDEDTVITRPLLPGRKRAYAALAATFASGLAAGVIIFAYEHQAHEAPIQVATAPLPPSVANLGRAAAATPPATRPGCPVGMVLIEGSRFTMGTSTGELDFEKPAHEVTLSAYCLDVTEVTAGKYGECVASGACSKAPATNQWPSIGGHDHKAFDPLCNGRDRTQRGDHPINCVDWSHAAAYCTARGARLPTEAEWEHAARGDDNRSFPWGDDDPSPKLLNACGKECETWSHLHGVDQDTMFDADDGWATTAPVGSYPLGAAKSGVRDLAGNVWEWTSDWYGEYTADASKDPRGPEFGTERVIRGGAWNGAYPQWVSSMFRYKNVPATRSYGVGFRCAKSI